MTIMFYAILAFEQSYYHMVTIAFSILVFLDFLNILSEVNKNIIKLNII